MIKNKKVIKLNNIKKDKGLYYKCICGSIINSRSKRYYKGNYYCWKCYWHIINKMPRTYNHILKSDYNPLINIMDRPKYSESTKRMLKNKKNDKNSVTFG